MTDKYASYNLNITSLCEIKVSKDVVENIVISNNFNAVIVSLCSLSNFSCSSV